MTTMRHRTFIGPTFYTAGKSLNENREVIRAQAQAFVNAVGVDNVVSVCEHAMTFGPFSVVVWYRAGTVADADDNAVTEVGNDLIARALQEAAPKPPKTAAPGQAIPGWFLFLMALAVWTVVIVLLVSKW